MVITDHEPILMSYKKELSWTVNGQIYSAAYRKCNNETCSETTGENVFKQKDNSRASVSPRIDPDPSRRIKEYAGFVFDGVQDRPSREKAMHPIPVTTSHRTTLKRSELNGDIANVACGPRKRSAASTLRGGYTNVSLKKQFPNSNTGIITTNIGPRKRSAHSATGSSMANNVQGKQSAGTTMVGSNANDIQRNQCTALTEFGGRPDANNGQGKRSMVSPTGGYMDNKKSTAPTTVGGTGNANYSQSRQSAACSGKQFEIRSSGKFDSEVRNINQEIKQGTTDVNNEFLNLPLIATDIFEMSPGLNLRCPQAVDYDSLNHEDFCEMLDVIKNFSLPWIEELLNSKIYKCMSTKNRRYTKALSNTLHIICETSRAVVKSVLDPNSTPVSSLVPTSTVTQSLISSMIAYERNTAFGAPHCSLNNEGLDVMFDKLQNLPLHWCEDKLYPVVKRALATHSDVSVVRTLYMVCKTSRVVVDLMRASDTNQD